MSTIAAIGTALGNSGISIIRVSGKESLKIISKVFNNFDKLLPNSIIHGKIYDKDIFIDDVLVSYFKAPFSFTGEDVCEVNCHGGVVVTMQILELMLRNGAIAAEPGEFSKRAFLNGKIDLSKAEGIINLINSKTKRESKIAASKINGELYNSIDEIRNSIIELIAHIEVSIDYPEYDYEEVSFEKIEACCDESLEYLKKLLKSYDEGKYIKNGINVAILGKPNVGKSSLFNSLIKKDRAIVTDIKGTTRDIIEDKVVLDDYVINLFDTAGIRKTDDVIEKIGVDKSIEKIEDVDLIIYVIDCIEGITEEDKRILSKIKNKDVKYLVVINKMDENKKTIFDTFLNEINKLGIKEFIELSIKEDKGLEELKKKIKELFFHDDINKINDVIIVEERQRSLINKAVIELEKVKEEIKESLSVDIITISLKQVSLNLGEIIGKDVSVDIVNKIFEKFCLGK
jgi:tRNA modification GTPase